MIVRTRTDAMRARARSHATSARDQSVRGGKRLITARIPRDKTGHGRDNKYHRGKIMAG
jgi:hypothetical protein